MTTGKAIFDCGENNQFPAVCKDCKVGSWIFGENGYRLVGEVVSVATNVAKPSYTCLFLLGAGVTGGTGGNGGKTPQPAGATVAANSAAPNAGGTQVSFYASEVTGPAAQALLVYVTADAPKTAKAHPVNNDLGGVSGLS